MVKEIDTSRILAIKGMTDAHMARRREYVTASNVPAIAGVDEYRNAADVYLWMVGAIDGGESSEPAAIGTAAEPTLQTLTENALGVKLTRRGLWNVKGCMGATLDALVADNRKLGAQFKTTGKVDDWEKGPPTRVIVQVTAEMVCADLDGCYVAVLLGGFGPLKFKLYLVERDEKLAADIERLAETFMMKYVVPRQMPPHVVPSGKSLSRIARVPNRVVLVDDAPVQEYLDAKAKRLEHDRAGKALKAIEEEKLHRIVSQIGDAEGAECGLGVLTYMKQHRGGYTVQPTEFPLAKFTAKKPQVLQPAASPETNS